MQSKVCGIDSKIWLTLLAFDFAWKIIFILHWYSAVMLGWYIAVQHPSLLTNKIISNLFFLKFLFDSEQIQKTIKKTARREQLMREEAEQKRLKTVLELQFILDKLGDDEVRSDLKQGSNGVPVLTEEELTMLDEFYKLVYPERDMNMR